MNNDNYSELIKNSKEVELLLGSTPIILKKKLNDKAKTIPLNTPNDLGYMRYFPATTAEWSSSIYAYNNNNNIKSLPVLDKKLVKLIKSFLNFYHKSEKLKSKSKRVLLRFRRLSLKKIFVSKADLKHTNSKVIINIHVYNLQKRLLKKEINIMRSVLFPKSPRENPRLGKSVRSLAFQMCWNSPTGESAMSILGPRSLAEKFSFVNLVISANYGSPFIFLILMEWMKKEKQLIITRSRAPKNKNKSINKGDIPYFFYLMKERLSLSFFRKEIEKEKFLMCQYNLDNRSINEWDFPSILSLIEDIEKEKLLIEKYIIQGTLKGLNKAISKGHIAASKKALERGLFYNRNLYDKIYNRVPLFSSIIQEMDSKSKLPQLDGCLNEVRQEGKEYFLNRNLWVKFIDNELELIRYYKFLLDLYDNKFKWLIPKLKEVISKIYKKKVEFNIVSLKNMYLNSDILCQAIVLKLKHRDNKLWKVLKSCLSMVQIPNADLENKNLSSKSLVSKIKNLDIDFLLSSGLEASPFVSAREASPLKQEALAASAQHKNKDSLNKLLFGIIPHPCLGDKQDFIEKACEGADNSSRSSILSGLAQAYSPKVYYKFFFKHCLKDKVINGVRLEAKGRLTRRFTAERSVFKLIWKGGLKNIDSSNKGFSAVILRGHAKSNVQYALINSKNRNGSYGVKSWVSGN